MQQKGTSDHTCVFLPFSIRFVIELAYSTITSQGLTHRLLRGVMVIIPGC